MNAKGSKPAGTLVRIGGRFRKRGAWWSIWGGSDGCIWIKITKDGKSKWRKQAQVFERSQAR